MQHMNINIYRKKLRLGIIYGLVAGLGFTLSAWGVDAWLLARAHDAYFWIKFFPGLIISLLAGGFAGWLTMIRQKHGFALLVWGLLAVLFTWSVIWLPFSGTPRILNLINPGIVNLLKYTKIVDLGQFEVICLAIIAMAALICGLLEINLIDQAVLSSYKSGFVAAIAVCLILFGIAGSASDQLINTSLREPVQAIDSLLQFAQDNFGKEVPKATARQMHLSSARLLGDLVKKPRKLTLISFDENLLIVDVLVNFTGINARCSAIYSQPTDCIILPVNP